MVDKQPPSSSTSAAEPGNMPHTNISYQPTLVPTLVTEHEGMVKHLNEVITSFDAGHLSKASSLLEQFKHETIAHVYKETTKLYLYLQYALVEKPYDFTQMRKLRKEMDTIVNYTMEFFKKYKPLETDTQKQETFKEEMQDLRERWMMRLEVEESILFPMYMPPATA